jgi:hypothetical protein
MDAKEFRRASQAVWDAMAPGWGDRHAHFEETALPSLSIVASAT